MTVFFLIGILFTLLAAAAGGVAWWWLGRGTGTKAKRRHREEARRLQEQFEADEDFAHNFHRPTQNELLETLQALDHLLIDWEGGDPALVEHRFKNELAESFPTLRKPDCKYPEPIAEDLSRLFGKGKLSAAAMDDRQRSHDLQVAQMRSTFHAARAQANAMHQISSGPAVGPVAMAPGSLPFRVRDASPKRARNPVVGRFAVVGVVLLCAGAAGAYFVEQNTGPRKQPNAVVQGASDSTASNPSTQPANVAKSVAVASVPNSAGLTPPSHSPAPKSGTLVQGGPGVGFTTPAPVEAALTVPVPSADGMGATVARSEPAPPPAVAPAIAPVPMPSTTPTLAQQVAESQQRAIEKYPDLAVPNTEINSRFVFRYKKLMEEKSVRLQDPNWPEKLAEECAAAAVGPKSKKITQASTTRR